MFVPRNFLIFLTSLCAAVLGLTTNAHANNHCGAVQSQYQDHEFGEVLSAISKSCPLDLSQKQQLFVAGISRNLLERCGFPSNINDRMALQTFLSSSALAGVIGSQYGNPDLGKGLGDQSASMAALTSGSLFANSLECDAMANGLADGIVKQVRSSAATDESPYVSGCVRYYGGKYSTQQCECVANIGKAITPNIARNEFSPRSIKRIIEANPFVGLQIAMQCGIGDY